MGSVLEEIKISEKKEAQTLNLILKITGLTTLFTGVFGLGFQKGMLLSMGLGNLNGNYELREIFNSAIFGGLHVFSLLNELIVVNVWSEFWKYILWGVGICIVIGVVGAFFANFKPENIEKLKSKCNWIVIKIFNRETAKKILAPSWWSYLFYPIVLALTYSVVASVLFITRYLLLGVGAAILLFSLLGYVVGESYVKTRYEVDPCVSITKEILKNEIVRQCTQVVINNKKIMGEILLENSAGYFLKRNDSFVFLKKDGQGCIYSKFVLTDELNVNNGNPYDFTKIDKELDKFCSMSDG